jgi:hypothetical protein
MTEREMSPLLPLELHPLLHPPLEIQMKTIFSLNLLCLVVGVTFVRNTMRKEHVRHRRVLEIRSLLKDWKPPLLS